MSRIGRIPVPVPAGGLVHSAPDAADLAASLGVPVAM